MLANKDTQRFIAFVLLGGGLMGLAILMYLRPLADSNTNSGVLQILNMIVGAFIGAFGGAATKFFDTAGKVTVDNPPSDPVNTSAVIEDEPKP